MSNEAILEARRLKLRRGTVAEQPLNFALCAGQCCIPTGENGAGKTTLLRVLCGLSEADRGTVLWHGFPIAQRREAYYKSLIYIGHQLGFRSGLSVKENLEFYRDLGNRHDTDNIEDALDYFAITDIAKQPYASLSRGQQQRSALCRLIIEQVPLWLLDEPTSALDKQGHDIFQELLLRHLSNGGIAIVTTHKPFEHSALEDAQLLKLTADA